MVIYPATKLRYILFYVPQFNEQMRFNSMGALFHAVTVGGLLAMPLCAGS